MFIRSVSLDVLRGLVRSARAPCRTFSSTTEQRTDNLKVRRAYVLGGCVVVMWLSTHAILLYNRRSEFRSLNKKVPPIDWKEFAEGYLKSGKVKSIIFQPHFEVGNVYLYSEREQEMKETIMHMIHTSPDKFSRPPDVRFCFEGSGDEVKNAIQSELAEGSLPIDVEIDQFPSYREVSFIIASSLFAVATVGLMK